VDSVHELSRRYFALQLDCPLLENDLCIAYDHRPMVCREHHVTSPAERCAVAHLKNVDAIAPPLDMTAALARMTGALFDEEPRTIPLPLTLEYAERHSAALRQQWDGRELLNSLVAALDPPHQAALAERRTDKPAADAPRSAAADRMPLPMVTADICLDVAGRRLNARLEVPAGPTPMRDLVPIARRLVGVSVSAVAEDAAAEGRTISCKAGCGACCRQLMPLTVPEAYLIRDLVERLPESRRSAVRARFNAARQRLQEAGMLAALEQPQPLAAGERMPDGETYRRLGIACPFLEAESCSIYEERPLVCREYLVVSPAEHCTRPREAGVEVLHPYLPVWWAFSRAGAPRADDRADWVPLILAPSWAETHAEATSHASGPEQLRALFAELTARDVPLAPV
jgi:Fe-S-cluster containining protein